MRRNADQLRQIRSGTSKAMKSSIGQCPACERKQWPIKFDITGLGHLGYVCRYCGHEWSPSLRAHPHQGEADE